MTDKQKMRLLLVEDQEADAELLLLNFRNSNYEVEHTRVDTLIAFTDTLKNNQWDAIICDHIMPNFSSYEALKITRDFDEFLPFIVISGKVEEEHIVDLMRAGANDCLVKGNLVRLIPALEREIREAEVHRKHKQTEKQLFQALKLEALGQLTSGIGHDFNNLLSIILGNAEILKLKELGADEYLDRIITAATRAGHITKRLLAFSRQQPLKIKTIDLAEEIEDMWEMLESSVGKKISLEFSNHSSAPIVSVDISVFESVILNLSINARDAMSGSGSIKLVVTDRDIDELEATNLDGIVAGEYTELSVTDTGPGIPEDILSEVLKPFYSTKGDQGTGLGLAMASDFAINSGGALSITSKVGVGTSVSLLLPKIDTALVTTEPKIVDTQALSGLGQELILVEDNEGIRSFTKESLEACDFKVKDFASGEEALEYLKNNDAVKLLITDVLLAGKSDGSELAAKIREIRPDLPLVFMSGYTANLPEMQKWIDRGEPFLLKPFSNSQLIQTIQSALSPE